MATLSQHDVDHIIQQLRNGTVPNRGLDAFAVGIEAERAEIARLLDLTQRGEGNVKFLRGDYGCGKTFMARLALLDAQARGFATSFVVVNDDELRLYKFEDLYSRIMNDLGTATCPRGALGDILDRWVSKLEDDLIASGADEEGPDFPEQVQTALKAELAALSGGQVPEDFIRVVQAIFQQKDAGDLPAAGALLSWLSGSSNVAASAKRLAQVKGDVGSRSAMEFLRGVAHIVKAAGYKGLAVVVDETETLLRSRSDTRAKSLNGLRQIVDGAEGFPGLLWIFTGTPEFFEDRRGIKGLAPLYDRTRFIEHAGFASLRQPQLRLRPFDDARLTKVAHRLRALFPATDRQRLERRVSDRFIEQLVADVNSGYARDVGVVPREFLREFVGQLDLVDENVDYDPSTHYQFHARPEALAEVRERAEAQALAAGPEDEGPVLLEDVW